MCKIIVQGSCDYRFIVALKKMMASDLYFVHSGEQAGGRNFRAAGSGSSCFSSCRRGTGTT